MDAESFKREFLPFHRKLYHIAYKLLENESDAEDIVQEAYLKLWNKRDGLPAISNPEAFCVTLLKNMCFDVLRSGKSSFYRHSIELCDTYETPVYEDNDAADQCMLIKKIISGLPEQQQKIVILRDIKECTYEEIENLTGLNSINIRVLLSRARKKIREKFIKLNGYEN